MAPTEPAWAARGSVRLLWAGIALVGALGAALLLWLWATTAALPIRIGVGVVGMAISGALAVTSWRLRRSVQQMNGALRDSESRNHQYRDIIHNTPDAILMLDGEGAIRGCNSEAQQLFGYSRSELLGSSAEMLLPERLRSRYHTGRARFDALAHSPPAAGRRNVVGRHRDGTEMALDIALSTAPGADAQRIIVFVRDLRERERLQQALLDQARRDVLTDLPNRAHFIEQFAAAIDAAGEAGMGVILLDLDNFKTVNDSWGHPQGDQLLVHVARTIVRIIPEQSLLARLGGDEFAILLRGISTPAQVMEISAQVLVALQQPVWLEHQNVPCGASVGVAMFPEDGRDHHVLLRRADLALFHAKAEGRGCVRRFDAALEKDINDRLDLQMLLHEALAKGQFHLHYQPQLSLASGEVCCFEALLRWRHPTRGDINPAEFIPVAEASGLIVAIGHWVLDAACLQIARLQRAGTPMTIAVNLSAHQVHQEDLVERVSAALQRHAVPACLLELELTESAVVRDYRQVARTLHRLNRLGVRLAIDDFGTGYSSFAYLKDFPLHKLKIDRSFITDMEEGNGLAIVQGLVSLAHSLGLAVVAEGVETERQKWLLEQCGCDKLQGWVFSAALPENELWPFLRHGQETECIRQ